MSKILYYNPNLKAYARDLRKNGTQGEALLWKKVLRARNMEGYQFNRQFTIGEYIVDFICRKLKLIIEIDGSSHVTKGPEDRNREDFLVNQGFTVLHIPEMEIVHRIDDVIKDIYHTIKCLEENSRKENL